MNANNDLHVAVLEETGNYIFYSLAWFQKGRLLLLLLVLWGFFLGGGGEEVTELESVFFVWGWLWLLLPLWCSINQYGVTTPPSWLRALCLNGIVYVNACVKNQKLPNKLFVTAFDCNLCNHGTGRGQNHLISCTLPESAKVCLTAVLLWVLCETSVTR